MHDTDSQSMPRPDTPVHAQPFEDVLEALSVSAETGLSRDGAAERRREHGENRIRRRERRGVLRIAAAQFRSLVVAMLSAAAALAFAFGKIREGIAVAAVIVVNCLIGFVSEWRAARSMEALRRMGRRRVRVRRDGEARELPAHALVPGDICLHEGGDMVSADLRLIEANGLRVDESALTGESVPVAKRADPVDEDRPLAERASMLYRGTTLTEGSAAGVVVATGMRTELGRIAELAAGAGGQPDTPLERRLSRLGHRLAWVALGAAALVGAAGLIAGKPVLVMVETAIALGVAAIPEGLPFVATIGLARGMWLMARRQALINRLPAVETLGTTDVIFADKTGTLTANRMVVRRLETPSGEYAFGENGEANAPEPVPGEDAALARALEVGALCNNASVEDRDADGEVDDTQGDPTEIALLLAAAEHGMERSKLLEEKPEVREVAFDPDAMMMATFHDVGGACEVAVKGAPQAVLQCCGTLAGEGEGESRPMDEEARERWNGKARAHAERGLRMLALADRRAESPDEEPYRDLRFLGLVGLFDPPAEGVQEALAACRRAGIRVVMVTGDQPETARAIAASLKIAGEDETLDVLTGSDLGDVESLSDDLRSRALEARVFARVTPEQKLRLLELFQEQGHTVAMTGDGVNDAPALKRADIGVAMGRRGTDAAKESADMVLKNDAFSSILSAVEQGRVIFLNIRKSVMFMLCTNLAEVLAVGIASLLAWPLPLRPLQILFLNVVTDVFPALALSVGRGDPQKAMRQPPRDAGESILDRPQWLFLGVWSLAISLCVLAALATAVHALGAPTAEAVTVSFLTLGLAKLGFVLNLRDADSTMFRNDIVSNGWMWVALSACALLLAAAVYAPGLAAVLETARPGARGWLVALALAAAPALAGQLHLAAKRPD